MVKVEMTYLVEWFPPGSEGEQRTFKIFDDAMIFASEVVYEDEMGEITIDEILTVSYPNGETEKVLCREWLQCEDSFDRV